MATLSRDGTAYDVAGPQNAPVVVLVHGLGLNRQTWDHFVPVLSEHYRVLRYDLCGHGESAQPLRIPNLTVLSDQLASLLDQLGIGRCAIIGFSLGGMINRRFAMDHAHRVSALVILNSPHERTPEAQRLVEERAAQTGAGGPAATIDSTLERWFTSDFCSKRPDVVAQIRTTVLANDPVNFTRHRHVLAQGVIELIRPVPPITTPTLVITCENDSGSTPEMSHAIASEIPQAKTLIVPGLQHMGLLERPDLFSTPILQFLTQTLRQKADQ